MIACKLTKAVCDCGCSSEKRDALLLWNGVATRGRLTQRWRCWVWSARLPDDLDVVIVIIIKEDIIVGEVEDVVDERGHRQRVDGLEGNAERHDLCAPVYGRAGTLSAR